VVKSIVEINDKISLVLMTANLNYKLLKELKLKLDFTEIKNLNKTVKSNVALSAAVTAYGRIEMIKYKTLPDITIYYSDTDSIICNKPLPSYLVGNKLGQMKNELIKKNTQKMERALFLGNKKYAYQYINNNTNKLTTLSVFSGVKRNYLT
jgi:hypothetical protein